ncbi:unnamed protein product [Allacma fusca]|uniref:Hexosyltransferase n=1 Tax=Allacma fusca TaxID=39272 RepID=A0A8J2LM40_9HEXA|nr:unnamed protein product [Allacma fusca]
MGSWLTLFHQLQVERDLIENDVVTTRHAQEPYFLLTVLILSAPNNFDLRDTIRSSWLRLSPSRKDIRHVFAVGSEGLEPDLLRRLRQENTVDNDLLLLPIHDSFLNLTLKVTKALVTMSMTMPSHYTIKVDDDSFVRVDKLVQELEDRQELAKSRGDFSILKKCFYWGFFDGRARVKKKGKWKESDYDLCDLYIPYALGGGYVISKACTDFIVKNHDTLRGYVNEDVTIGTWLSSISPERRHDTRFDTEYESRGCNNKYIVQHKLTQAEMIERYKNLAAHHNLCSTEYRKRMSIHSYVVHRYFELEKISKTN